MAIKNMYTKGCYFVTITFMRLSLEYGRVGKSSGLKSKS